jgi:hypothetical protein
MSVGMAARPACAPEHGAACSALVIEATSLQPLQEPSSHVQVRTNPPAQV